MSVQTYTMGKNCRPNIATENEYGRYDMTIKQKKVRIVNEFIIKIDQLCYIFVKFIQLSILVRFI